MGVEKDDAGRQLADRIRGPKSESFRAALDDLDPSIASWVDNFVFGEIWTRPGISEEERFLVAISALIAREHHPQLRNYLNGALEYGVAASKLHEAIISTIPYCGFTAVLNALGVWQEILRSARRRGLDVDIDCPR